MATTRYAVDALTAFAQALLLHAGVRADIAQDVADVLVAGDLLGHTTHGLALLAGYLGELEKGAMAKDGAPKVVNARAAAQTWDGGRLPGPWLTLRALDAAAAMAATHGTGTVVIRRAHHIACLAVVPAAGDRTRTRRDRAELGSRRRGGRPARRHDTLHHAQSDRRRTAHVR